MNRLQVRAQVLECTSCDLNARCAGPVPFSGPAPATVAILGEAPGREEDDAGQPFIGRSGQLLRRLLGEAGFDPEDLFWLNAASCFPTRPDGRGRVPLQDELNACADNRRAQLRLANPKWVVLAGNVPLHLYRPDLRIGKAHGRAILRQERVFYPIYHPAAALRNPAWETDIRADLSLLKKMVAEEDWTLSPETCIECEMSPEEADAPWHWDDEGIPYCDPHWSRVSR